LAAHKIKMNFGHECFDMLVTN